MPLYNRAAMMGFGHVQPGQLHLFKPSPAPRGSKQAIAMMSLVRSFKTNSKGNRRRARAERRARRAKRGYNISGLFQ